jgi:hypothetical protein
MKHIGMFLFFMLMLSLSSIKAQQNVAVTAIFQKNICQSYQNDGLANVKIEYKISGLSNEAAQAFNTKALKNDKVVSSNVASNLSQGLRVGKLEITSQADFDYIKNIFVEGGIAFVHVEDVIMPIEDWKAFTAEQCAKITQLNTNIENIEFKLNYTQNNPTQKAMAESNGWFTEAYDLLNKAKEAKINFLESIK